MADQPARRVDMPGSSLDPDQLKRVKMLVFGVLALVVLGGVFAIVRYIGAGKDQDRWEKLATLERAFDDGADRSWLDPTVTAADIAAREEHVKRLEEFLPSAEADKALSAHVHMRIANLQLMQITSLLGTGDGTVPDARFEAAKSHLTTVRDNYPDAQVNWSRFAPERAASVTRLVLEKLEGLRKWQKEHAAKPATPDEDVVLVLRTTEGDLRLKFFASASPKLTASLLARACAGSLDGTTFFEKRDDTSEGWVRGGDPRASKLDATDDERLTWGTTSPGDPLLAEEGRNRILHTKGIVSAWHETGEESDDPLQFIVVTKPSSELDFEYTPFARVDEASLTTLERIAARRSRAQDKVELRADPKLSRLADQLVTPVVIKKALVYDKHALRACHDASKVDETEKRDDTLKLDAYREMPPPTPPAAPAPGAAPGAPAPAMDGSAPPAPPAGMSDEPAMDAAK